MFLINYGILEEERNRISQINDIEEFEADLNDVEGQIELILNNTKEGFYHKDILCGDELLLIWFTLLNDILILLKAHSFAAMHEPENDRWFEFYLENEEVVVSKIRAEMEIHVEELIVDSPKKEVELFWSERISKKELYETILESTEKFIKDVLSINKLLSESRKIIELKDKYIKAEEIYESYN